MRSVMNYRGQSTNYSVTVFDTSAIRETKPTLSYASSDIARKFNVFQFHPVGFNILDHQFN